MGNSFSVGVPLIRQPFEPYDCGITLCVKTLRNTVEKLTFTNIATDQVLASMCEEFVSSPNLLYDLTVEKTNIQPDTAVTLGKIV